MDILTQLKTLYLLLLAPLVFIITIAILGIGWAIFFSEFTDKLDSRVDKWVFRGIWIFALLLTIYVLSFIF